MENFYKIMVSRTSSVKQKLTDFWAPGKKINLLLEEIRKDRARIKILLEDLNTSKQWNFEYSSVLNGVTNSMKVMVWSKDAKNKYILANSTYCKIFLNFETSDVCLEEIKNKSISDLLVPDHPFLNLCNLSDEQTKKVGKSCHFIEAALLDGKELLFYIIKIPEFDGEEFKGIQCVAWDLSPMSDFIIKLLNRWIYEEKATKIFMKEEVFSYQLTPDIQECEVFKHICPTPSRNIAETNFCNIPECIKRKTYIDKLETGS